MSEARESIRLTSFITSRPVAVLMVFLAIGAYLLAGPEYRARRGPEEKLAPEPVTAVTGHA